MTSAHDEALGELIEWWEDLHDCATGSQAVVLAVPTGWGRTEVLNKLASQIDVQIDTKQHLGAVIRLWCGEAPEGLALQVEWLRRVLDKHGISRHLSEALGLNRAEGVTELGLGAAGLLGVLSGAPEAAAGLPGAAVLKWAAWRRDQTQSGQLAQVVRLANDVVRYSMSLPLAVLIDDGE